VCLLIQERDQRLILSSGRAARSSLTPASVTLVAMRLRYCKLWSPFNSFSPASVTPVELSPSLCKLLSSFSSLRPASVTGSAKSCSDVKLLTAFSSFNPASVTLVPIRLSACKLLSCFSSFIPVSVTLVRRRTSVCKALSSFSPFRSASVTSVLSRFTSTTGLPAISSSLVTVPPSFSIAFTVAASSARPDTARTNSPSTTAVPTIDRTRAMTVSWKNEPGSQHTRPSPCCPGPGRPLKKVPWNSFLLASPAGCGSLDRSDRGRSIDERKRHEMYTSSGGSRKRQEIVAGVILIGGLILFTLLLGRPGDLGAGLIGAVIFCAI